MDGETRASWPIPQINVFAIHVINIFKPSYLTNKPSQIHLL